MKTRVKICGLTTFEAANTALNNGADALGFVFYDKSPRVVTAEQASFIIKGLPPFCTLVGLFVNANREYIKQVIKVSGINLLQFHGDESNEFCRSFKIPFIKAIRVTSQQCIEHAVNNFPDAKALLLDTYVEGVPGGTGQAFDWTLIPSSIASKVIVAGGLKTENVSAVVHQVHPYAVDVSGGVESSKGIKSNTMITAFLDAVRQADCKEVKYDE